MLWTDHRVKILSCFLLLSLAANAGMASFMAGRHAGDTMLQKRGQAMMEMVRDLPPEERKAAAEILRDHRPAMQKAMAAVREQRETIRGLAAQDDIDAQAMKEAFAELRRRTDAATAEGQALALDLLPHVPPVQRKALLTRQGRMMP